MGVRIDRRDLIWSFAGVTSSLLSYVILIPFMMRFLDGDALGLWYVFQSLGTVAVMFDFGFSIAFGRSVAYCWSGARSLKKTGSAGACASGVDFTLLSKILAACRRIYLCISVAVLAVCLTGGAAYVLYLTGGRHGGAYLAAWFIYAGAIFFNLYYGYFASFLRGVGAVAEANQATVLARAVQMVTSVILLLLGYGIIAASAAYLLYGFCFRILANRLFYRYQGIGERLRHVRRRFSPREIREILRVTWPNAWRGGVVSFSDYFANQAGTIICSLYFSLTETAGYSLSVQCASAISVIAATAYAAYQPSLQKAFVTRDIQKSRQDMSFIVVTYVILFLIGITAFAGAVMPLLARIKSDVSLSVPVVLAVGLYQFLLGLRNCYASYLSCANRLDYMPGFVAAAILCVALSFVMTGALGLGVWGPVLAGLLSHAVYNLWKWPLQVHKELTLSVPEMWPLAYRELRALPLKRENGKGA